jgi:hypothetical protein
VTTAVLLNLIGSPQKVALIKVLYLNKVSVNTLTVEHPGGQMLVIEKSYH